MDQVMAYALVGVYAASVLTALAALALACISDFKTMTIPNRLPVAIAGAFIFAWGAALLLEGMGVVPRFSYLRIHAIALGIMLVVTFVMFVFKIWGGGDSKLASAAGLWIGLSGIPSFLMVTALTGLFLAMASYAGPFLGKAQFQWPPGSWPARLAAGKRVLPYGIAIAAGTFSAFLHLGYMDVVSMIQQVAKQY